MFEIITVENTKENKGVAAAVASVELSGMYPDEKFVRKLLKVANGKMTSEELRQEVIRKYQR